LLFPSALVDALWDNTSLKILRLSGCGIGDAAAAAVAGWIQKSHAIVQVVHTSYSQSSDHRQRKCFFVEACRYNTSMMSLKIERCSAAYRQRIKESLDSNRFRTKCLEEYDTISPVLYPFILARVW
jgi:hypothetical protein